MMLPTFIKRLLLAARAQFPKAVMSIKIEAAYHEAAHIIVAHRSKFHSIAGAINLKQYGAGEALISLSKSKLAAHGKAPSAESQRDREVTQDIAPILVAGLVGEKIAAEKNDAITPNPSCAEPDYELLGQLLIGAGLSKKFDVFEDRAEQILRNDWQLVDRLAHILFERGGISLDELIELLSLIKD